MNVNYDLYLEIYIDVVWNIFCILYYLFSKNLDMLMGKFNLLC